MYSFFTTAEFSNESNLLAERIVLHPDSVTERLTALSPATALYVSTADDTL
jgi:hypothetical protein